MNISCAKFYPNRTIKMWTICQNFIYALHKERLSLQRFSRNSHYPLASITCTDIHAQVVGTQREWEMQLHEVR
jgi:hypothetical protein